MRMLALTAALLLGACTPSGRAHRDIALTSQAMTLPAETATFPAGAAIVSVNCTACHSPELILTQPRLGAEKWQAEVTKMRGVYKASIDPADDAKIAAALVALQK